MSSRKLMPGSEDALSMQIVKDSKSQGSLESSAPSKESLAHKSNVTRQTFGSKGTESKGGTKKTVIKKLSDQRLVLSQLRHQGGTPCMNINVPTEASIIE